MIKPTYPFPALVSERAFFAVVSNIGSRPATNSSEVFLSVDFSYPWGFDFLSKQISNRRKRVYHWSDQFSKAICNAEHVIEGVPGTSRNYSIYDPKGVGNSMTCCRYAF